MLGRRLLPLCLASIVVIALVGCESDPAPTTGGPGGNTPSYCDTVCPMVIASGCTNGPQDLAQCEEGCNQAALTCPTEFNELAQCSGSQPTYACDIDNSPYVVGCQDENAIVNACAGGLPAYCFTRCPNEVAAACANGPATEEDCHTACTADHTACPSELAALANCTGDQPTYTCESGDPVVAACVDETGLLELCLDGIAVPAYCIDICDNVVTADCDFGPPTAVDCYGGCANAAFDCPNEYAALETCAGNNATFSCDPVGGVPLADGCETEQEAVYACDMGIPAGCYSICPEVITADCAGGPPNLEDCYEGCVEMSGSCASEFNALMTCAGTDPTFHCDSSTGIPIVTGCETQHNALYVCAGM